MVWYGDHETIALQAAGLSLLRPTAGRKGTTLLQTPVSRKGVVPARETLEALHRLLS